MGIVKVAILIQATQATDWSSVQTCASQAVLVWEAHVASVKLAILIQKNLATEVRTRAEQSAPECHQEHLDSD